MLAVGAADVVVFKLSLEVFGVFDDLIPRSANQRMRCSENSRWHIGNFYQCVDILEPRVMNNMCRHSTEHCQCFGQRLRFLSITNKMIDHSLAGIDSSMIELDSRDVHLAEYLVSFLEILILIVVHIDWNLVELKIILSDGYLTPCRWFVETEHSFSTESGG